MVREFFAQRSDLLGGDGTGLVSPLASFIRENVGDLFIGQCFVPRLHHCCAKLLAFHFDWALQTFENNHRRTLRAAGCKLRARKWRILASYAFAVGLMTRLTIC